MTTSSPHALIIGASANKLVTDLLISGAQEVFLASDVINSNLEIVRVAGALEIPLALKRAVLSKGFDVYVVAGVVIKGETDHYEHVSRMANDGVLSVAIEHGLALGNAILCLHNMAQALDRAGGPKGHVGREAALAALGLLRLSL